ncbi:hypothetical protein BF28_5825 (plasmid) [Bacillus cereus E33L]|nr:hypothetical protein BF28_5825 [Bacillus cereus E33L]
MRLIINTHQYSVEKAKDYIFQNMFGLKEDSLGKHTYQNLRQVNSITLYFQHINEYEKEIDYLQNFVKNFQLPVMINQRVGSVEREGEIYLSFIGAMELEGKILQVSRVSTEIRGGYYVGLEGQRSFSSTTLRGVGSDAKFVVRKLISYLKNECFR